MKLLSMRSWIAAGAGVLILSSLQSTFAAPPTNRSTERQRFGQLVSLRSRAGKARPATARAASRVSDPFSNEGVDAFNRRVLRQGRTPPPIPQSLLINPRPAGLQQVKNFREDYILSLYRFRGLRRGGFAGGAFFTPPSGTPAFPVDPVNIFNYFPVLRVP